MFRRAFCLRLQVEPTQMGPIDRVCPNSGCGLINVLRSFYGKLRKITETSIRIAGVRADIRTDHLLNPRVLLLEEPVR
jgi:hypothetical protein